MRNDELLRQLGWSEALISEMSKTAAQMQSVAQIGDVLEEGYGMRLSVTTDRILYQGSEDLES